MVTRIKDMGQNCGPHDESLMMSNRKLDINNLLLFELKIFLVKS